MITWVSKKSWKIFLSGFTQALEINPCTRTLVCNTFELMDVSGDILNAGGNAEEKYDYGFTWSFSKKASIVINDNTKMILTKTNSTPKLNIDQQQFNNTIYENIDKRINW